MATKIDKQSYPIIPIIDDYLLPSKRRVIDIHPENLVYQWTAMPISTKTKDSKQNFV